MPPLTAVSAEVRVAEAFVATGRVVPGLTVSDDGRARSWWWPMPSAGDRGRLALLLDSNEVADHVRVAGELAGEVDRLVRERLRASGVELIGRHAGRRTVPDVWLRSLTADDPWFPASLDLARVEAFAATVERWVRSGVVGIGRARLRVRVHEPLIDDERWVAEALAQDVDEPSLLVGVAEVWSGRSPFGPAVVEELLASLGRMARIAPELPGLLDGSIPDRTALDSASVIELFTQHVAALAEADVAILLPSWWINRGRLGLRARTSKTRKAVGAVISSGLGFDEIVSFTWQVALGDARLTKAELAALARAVQAKQSLVRVRGMWVQVRPDEIAALLGCNGASGQATAGELVRAGLGLDALDAPDETTVVGVDAEGWLGAVLDDALHATVAPVPTPVGFSLAAAPVPGARGRMAGILGRLGLGACQADDMGLGKTAQVIASVLSDAALGPTLVVCPTSVLGSWERELARFARSLRVLVHYGPDRFRGHDVPFAARPLPRM